MLRGRTKSRDENELFDPMCFGRVYECSVPLPVDIAWSHASHAERAHRRDDRSGASNAAIHCGAIADISGHDLDRPFYSERLRMLWSMRENAYGFAMRNESLDQDAPQTSRSSGYYNHCSIGTLIAAFETADTKPQFTRANSSSID
jgi:hypothetical protein